MKKQDEIAKLIDGSRKDADQLIRKVNDALSERATFSEISHALRKLSSEKRTPEDVIISLGGKPKVVERKAIKPLTPSEKVVAKPKTEDTNNPKATSYKLKLKTDWQEFEKILKVHHVSCLYHFTDSKNIPSILEHGGLFSWHYCMLNSIAIPCPGGNDLSRQLDLRNGLQDYVRLGFNTNPPMMYCVEHIQNPVILEVDPSVIYWATTKFSDLNATDNLANVGDDLDSFKNIKLNIAINSYWNSEMEKKWRQAEVLVKTHVPISFITIT